MRLRALPGWNERPMLARRSYGVVSLAIVLLTVLAVLSVSAASVLGQANAWLHGPDANTIHVSFTEGGAAQGRARFDRLARTLIASDGVLAFRRNRGANGDEAVILVDIYMDPGAERREKASAAIAAVLPDAEIDDPISGAGSLERWIDPATWLAVLAALALLLWLGAAVSHAAGRMVATHALEVEVLEMVGATRVQVSRPFERRIIRLILGASAAGIALTIFLLASVRSRGSVTVAEALNLPATIAVVVLLTPLLLVVVAKLTARIAVLRSLQRRRRGLEL